MGRRWPIGRSVAPDSAQSLPPGCAGSSAHNGLLDDGNTATAMSRWQPYVSAGVGEIVCDLSQMAPSERALFSDCASPTEQAQRRRALAGLAGAIARQAASGSGAEVALNLNLSRNSLDAGALYHVGALVREVTALAPQVRLRVLRLSDNRLGDEGARALAGFVASQPHALHEIHLEANGLTPTGAAVLLRAFAEHPTRAYPSQIEGHEAARMGCLLQLERNKVGAIPSMVKLLEDELSLYVAAVVRVSEDSKQVVHGGRGRRNRQAPLAVCYYSAHETCEDGDGRVGADAGCVGEHEVARDGVTHLESAAGRSPAVSSRARAPAPESAQKSVAAASESLEAVRDTAGSRAGAADATTPTGRSTSTVSGFQLDFAQGELRLSRPRSSGAIAGPKRRDDVADLASSLLAGGRLRRELVQSLVRRGRGGVRPPLCVDLSGNELRTEAVKALDDLLAGVESDLGCCVHLRILKLYNNRLGDDGAIALAKLLLRLRNPVHELHVSHNGITEKGAAALILALAKHPAEAYPFEIPGKAGSSCGCWVRLEQNAVSNPNGLLEEFFKNEGRCMAIHTKDRSEWGPLRVPAGVAPDQVPPVFCHMFLNQGAFAARPLKPREAIRHAEDIVQKLIAVRDESSLGSVPCTGIQPSVGNTSSAEPDGRSDATMGNDHDQTGMADSTGLHHLDGIFVSGSDRGMQARKPAQKSSAVGEVYFLDGMNILKFRNDTCWDGTNTHRQPVTWEQLFDAATYYAKRGREVKIFLPDMRDDLAEADRLRETFGGDVVVRCKGGGDIDDVFMINAAKVMESEGYTCRLVTNDRLRSWMKANIVDEAWVEQHRVGFTFAPRFVPSVLCE
eukprot:TRINITY_DN23054_c0_g1_i2.p1 TRINITY_DN23054_c0_g1~~TRINITY_DN23054_c0_g1_i2.p1  ORF type:complete len:849 (-),score=155.32 TRINITY_DN23054_c0_g1_i2:6-2552(-)